jgi:hypothetical protein
VTLIGNVVKLVVPFFIVKPLRMPQYRRSPEQEGKETNDTDLQGGISLR